ncbi:MAG: Peptidase M22 glycoprotease [Candidatus Tokpelaia hoelldobleri]|uniref:Peptidase M22 glycoprotease n=1 Tax=Candidatus Tokpelaia hoelldobleri TaxID=1902579 RepID=A0A1U9JW74_9HYPH|nr:MAG: Peptidase M22 glycoprotease [Candidatus Tokpelaia hoelldoblerii]
MLVLALDTASAFCAAALVDNGDVLAQKSENIGKGHAEYLMGYIAATMKDAGCDFAAIDRIAVNIGPGSFTGVRVGVAAARGLALALDKPAIGITAFEALAYEAQIRKPGQPASVVLEAHRGALYCQHFTASLTPASPPQVSTAQEIAPTLPQDAVLTGSGAEKIAALRPCPLIGTRPTAEIATYARLAMQKQPGTPPSPLYMRAPDAKPQAGFILKRA